MQNLRDRVIELWSVRHIPAHDLKHTLRVASLARRIAAAEGYDPDEAEAAGLLHDLGRLEQDEEDGHSHAGIVRARDLLDELTSFSVDAKERIVDAIGQHSNRHSTGQLANILQDADKLDGLGAIGLVRAYVSKSHLPDYEGHVVSQRGSRQARTISEQIAFQMEWFDMLYTRTAGDIAAPRHAFMRAFLSELQREVAEAAE